MVYQHGWWDSKMADILASCSNFPFCHNAHCSYQCNHVLYAFTISNRYQVKRTCHTKPIVTDCLLPCGLALWESLTTASTLLSMICLRARIRNQVSVAAFAHSQFKNWISVVYVLFSLLFSYLVFFSFSIGKCQYSHDFMLQLRYCPAACVRPQDMKLIPGVTDNTPGTVKTIQKPQHVLS